MVGGVVFVIGVIVGGVVALVDIDDVVVIVVVVSGINIVVNGEDEVVIVVNGLVDDVVAGIVV